MRTLADSHERIVPGLKGSHSASSLQEYSAEE
jgi:hypothetical protein